MLSTFALISAFASDRGSPIKIDIEKASAHWLAAGITGLSPPEAPNGLARIPAGSIGRFDYDLPVERTGWYQLLVDASSQIARTEFLFDGANSEPPVRLEGGRSSGDKRYEAGWVWLTQGTHRLRVQHLSWTGFPQITGMQLEPDRRGEAFAFRLLRPAKTVFAVGTCAPLQIEAGGGNATAFTIEVIFRNSKGISRRKLVSPASSIPVLHSIDVPCDSAGDLAVELRSSSSHGELNTSARADYAIFDTSPVEPTYERGDLVTEIDMVNRQPDFQAGESAVLAGPSGHYRATGENGSTPFVRYQGRSLLMRMLSLEQSKLPNWFAYRVEGLLANQPHIMEVEYPDDKPRVFVVALRFGNGRGYPTSIGAETGVIWPLTHRMATMSAVVWPSASDGRVIVFNIHNGMKAAVARVRIYKAILRQKPLRPRSQGRDVLFWSEEGDNFRDVVGEGHEPDAVFRPVDRYLSLARSAGATIVSPTAVVYNFAMYPSRYHLAFADGDRDMTAAFMLGAEHYGLKIVPQLHPRADELVWPPRDQAELEKRLLLSAHGEHHLLRPSGDFLRPPYYNPFNRDIRRWYLDMVGELADRYKEYPAFAGIDLRLSNWQNPTLNNLASLDWGYEADTVDRFFRDTGLTRPAGLDLESDRPAAAKARYRYLIHTYRTDWIRWRCEKMGDIYRDIAQRIRAARPDLRLYVSIFGERTWNAETMREFGIDVELLRTIDGLTLTDARLGHGARESELDWRRTQHDDLASPSFIGSDAGTASRPSVMFPMEYIEITRDVAPAGAIGLPPVPKEPWISSAIEPPGRLALMRFAAAVGLADPNMIGDGGNGYVFGHDMKMLRSFMEEFRALPPRPFERIPGVPNAIVVRQGEGMFYVVNMLGVSLSVHLRMDGTDSIRRMTSGDVVPSDDGILRLALDPYQIATFSTSDRNHPVSARVLLNKDAQLDFETRAASARQSASRACARLLGGKSCNESRARSQQIDAAIAQGSYWTAERLLQSLD